MTDQREHTTSRLIETGVVAVVRLRDPEELLFAADALVGVGLTAIEITMSVPDAAGQIAALVDRLGDGHLVGVGSVRTADEVRRATDAGARYVVSPVFRPAVIEAAHAAGAAALPGCFTPTEIAAAHDAGADIIKVFPGGVVGPGFFKAVLAPMPELRLMPTGGVSVSNAGEWIAAGAVAVGMGGDLLDKAAIAQRDAAALGSRAAAVLDAVRTARAARAH